MHLILMMINCGAGLLGHRHYGGFDLLLALLVSVCAVLGTLAGVGDFAAWEASQLATTASA